jgi:PKD repeat protein
MEKNCYQWEIKCFLIILAISFRVSAQELKYLPCQYCQGLIQEQSFKYQQYTDDVVSDYGKRNAIGASSWHRGTDLTVSGTEDYGYQLLSPVEGNISKIFVGSTGYKYIVIDGPGHQEFGFGHIFNDQSIPIVVGDLVLQQCTNSSTYAIINLNTQKAIGPVGGAMVTYGNTTYEVSSHVDEGQVIAPLGTSGSAPSHVHVYHPAEPYVDPQTITNAKDPMEALPHFPTTYSNHISNLHNLALAAFSSNQPGHFAGTVPVYIGMLQPGVLGSSPNQYYHAALMDVDRVELFMRPENKPVEPYTQWGTASSNYQLIRGPNYFSFFSNGSRMGSAIYPSVITGNDMGSQGITGILPQAYNSAPDDIYYFADIYTRIHKDHVMGTPLQLAGISDEARYNDGVYQFFIKSTRVTGTVNAVNFPLNNQIRIDNFRPYIKRVTAKLGYMNNPFYVAQWEWNGNALVFNQVQSSGVMQGNDITVQVTTSEPMRDIILSINTWSSTEATAVDQSNDQVWVIQVPSYVLIEGELTFRISGHDMAWNLVEGFNNCQPKTAGSFPVRTSQTQWNPYPYEYEDIVHHISVIGNTPIVADFYPQMLTVSPGDYVTFSDLSTGDNILGWSWVFEEGDPGVSNTPDPVVQFNTPGDHLVTLTIHNSLMSSTSTGIISVVNEELPPVADFTPKDITVSLYTSVHFMDLSTGSPDSWYWDFDGADQPSELQNPVVEFNHTGTYYIILVVMNNAGASEMCGTVTVVEEEALLDVMCLVNPFLASPGTLVNLQGSVLNGSPPYSYLFDFGDGTIIPLSSSSISESVNHTYFASGNYNLTVTVTDAYNRMNTCFENVEVLGGNPCAGLNAGFTISPGGALFSVPVNNVVTFTDNSSGGTPPYLYHWTFSPDPITGSQPSLGTMTGQGPFNVSFPQPGNYPVSLHISDMNGCGHTMNQNITVFQPQHCLVAKINKMVNGKLIIGLGINNFWDFTFVPWCGLCQDPPGTSNYPCETNNYWKLVSHPSNTLLSQKYGLPFEPQGCSLHSSMDQMFQYNFLQPGWYKLLLRAWDEDCNVADGFDCQDATELLIRVIDCNQNINICNSNYIIWPGYNEDVYTGTITAGGSNCPMIIPLGTDIDFLATEEINLESGFEAQLGSEFVAAIRACPISGNTPSRLSWGGEAPLEQTAGWEVYPDPVKQWLSVRFREVQTEPFVLSIYNLLGESVFTRQYQAVEALSVDFTSFSPGIYLISYRGRSGERVKKIIKE